MSADCVTRSLRSMSLVTVPGPHDSIMAGLNCGTPSMLAWPLVSRGIDVAVTIDDDWAREAMCRLADAGVTAGETGAAALGGLMAVLSGENAHNLRRSCGLGADVSLLVLSTEGATDPEAYQQIVGHEPAQACLA